MSFWSGEKLAQELPQLIEPFDEKQIDCAAYTLRIGREVYISPINTAEAASVTRRKLEDRESFVIPPGQFAFLLTEERIRVPPTAVGFISMKARVKFRGLVNVSGFHVDPGYEGPLVFSIFNAGPSPQHLAQGDNCFLIWYASLDRETGQTRKAPPLSGITSDLINPIAGEVQSLANLSGRLDRVEREHQILRWIGTTVITLAIALLIRGCPQQSTQSSVPPVTPSATTSPAQALPPAANTPQQTPAGQPLPESAAPPRIEPAGAPPPAGAAAPTVPRGAAPPTAPTQP
jgi:dCTP deaminase